jgi:hypothetical protein
MELPLIENLLVDFKTIHEAHEKYLRLVGKLKESNPFASGVVQGFMRGSSLTLERLRVALTRRDQLFGLRSNWYPEAYVFIGHSSKGFYVVRRGNESAIVFDVTLLLTVVSFIFVTGYDPEDKNLMNLAAYLFVVISLSKEQTLKDYIPPFIHELCQLNPIVFDDVLGSVADIIFLHEIGHIYCRQNGWDFLRLKFALPDYVADKTTQVIEQRWHDQGYTYNVAMRPDGLIGHILLNPKFKLWAKELGADTFSIVANALVVREVYSTHSAIEAISDAYTTWQLVFHVLGHKQDISRQLFSSNEIGDLHHPIGAVRADVALFHINYLMEQIDADYRSPALGRSYKHYGRLWAPEFHAAVVRAVNYCNKQARNSTSHKDLFVLSDRDPPGIFEAFNALALHPILGVCDCYYSLDEDHGNRAILDAISERQQAWDEFFTNCQDEDGQVFVDLAQCIRGLGIRFVSEERERRNE